MSDDSIVNVSGLTKRFGDFVALNQCSLTIGRGEVFGLLGPNGAGKSTLIRLLLGFLNQTEGQADVSGFCCHRERVKVHQLVSYLPGDARLYRMMKARSLLRLFCQFRQDASFEKGCRIAERLELDLTRWVGLMSTGMRQKLALAICLANEAPLVILDEPTANLDPTVRGQVIQLINELQNEGRTVVFSSHVLPEIEETCDRVGILRKGELVHLESIAELNRKHRITAKLDGPLPEIPSGQGVELDVKQTDRKVQIETSSELSQVLKWLAEAPIADVMIQPVGLRSVYDRFHFADSIVPVSEAIER